MGKILGLLLAVALIFAFQSANAGSDGHTAVVKVRSKTVKVFQDHEGKKKVAEFKKGQVSLPIPIIAGPSPKGFFMLEIAFIDPANEPVKGWVRKRDVKTDKVSGIDVRCKTLASTNSHQTTAVRGLGEGC
ncbi:MAG: hypothetical protein MI806_15340 [Minwuiales bacterium]|nr:hypothetical protein [Minwuiales bacterium]